jgi:hypothetical protein
MIRDVNNGKVSEIAYTPSSPLIDPKAQRLLMVTMDGTKNKLAVVDLASKQGYTDPVFDQVFSPLFSPDGKHYAYRARNGKNDVIVVDGKVVRTFSNSGTSWSPVFSLDGSKIMFTVKRGKAEQNTIESFDILNGTSTSFVSFEFPSDFQTDTDQSIFNESDYAAGISRGPKVYDDKKINWAEFIIDHNASRKSKDLILYVNVNGINVPDSFAYVSEITFDATGKFVMFGARKGSDLLWKVYKITPSGLVDQI